MTDYSPPRPCLLDAWHEHEGELRAWLRRAAGDDPTAEDLLQDLFLKSLRQGDRFCEVRLARGWLFAAARHTFIDHARRRRPDAPLPEALSAPPPREAEGVDTMASCLPRALSELDSVDADVLQRCDIDGLSQAAYAREHGLSVPGAKSRLQRARRRLKAHLTAECQVRFDDEGQVCCFVPRPEPGNAED